VCKVNCDLPILGLQRYAVAVVGCWIAAAYPAFSPRVVALDRCCSLIGRAVTGGGAAGRAIRGRSSGVHERRTTLTVRIVQYTRSHIYLRTRHIGIVILYTMVRMKDMV